ncbi:MAG TPA: hypothetical protein VLS85_04585 [Hanamia sp.]|nr:hypothetical protein [Hanamia sp.]
MKPQNIPHPSFFLDAQIIDLIRQFTSEAERMGALHPKQLSVIYKENWFNLYVPTEYGGLGLSLPEGLRIQESLAWIDGSTGWTVTLCSGANWFIGFLQPETAATIFNSDKVCLAGSGRQTGIAKMINDDEYEISGRWPYATGAAHATAFTANCLIEKDGEIMQNEDGSPMSSAFIFLRNEVSVIKDWKVMGMIATSSNSFEVKKLRVNKNRCFAINEKQTVLSDKIYQYPFLQFAETTLAVNISGMAIHYLDLFEAIIKERNSDEHFTNEQMLSLSLRHDTAKNQLDEARQAFYQIIQHSWNEGRGSKHFSSDTLTEVSKASRQLATTSTRMVDEMFPYCGLTSADPQSEINRTWRNLHTACLHPLLLL